MGLRLFRAGEGLCKLCGQKHVGISEALSVCVDCVRSKPDEALPLIEEAHKAARAPYGLPAKAPKTPGGISCDICSNECVIGRGERGFCGLRKNANGKLETLTDPSKGVLYAYRDPHVTNCCSAWFCPAGTGAGYPKYACKPGPEFGYANYAVFFYGCNFDCLFCQNASHKNVRASYAVTLSKFKSEVQANPKYSCICYFGGSPEPQLPFALNASRTILEENPNRIIRICFEWNGCGNPRLVRQASELALISGGNIKFDLKCFNETLSLALSGVSNKRAYENFEMIASEFYEKRSDIPVLTATTLLVPGYVDASEVEQIARFIAELNPSIPYSLLVFHPQFMMRDLPITPKRQVEECYRSAKKYLRKVHIGNIHLLGLSALTL
jgi:pyruvate formate lyase activating enzyme